MPKYGCIVILGLLIVTVLTRAIMLKRQGIQAFVFAKTHHSDWILPPIVLFYVYHLFANVFDLPRIHMNNVFNLQYIDWFGLIICILGLCLFFWGVLSFGMSFRVGIDDEHPSHLVTMGAFSLSRNPLYVAFAMELLGFFLVIPNLMFLVYMLAGFWLLRRQIVREEMFLLQCYGKEYEEYVQRVRRYL